MAVSTASRIDRPLLLVRLADGGLHSGEWLARDLKVSRAAVWKGVERLRALGVAVQALPRRGYRLSNPVELLDARRIGAELDPVRLGQLRKLELLFEVDSTNTRLLGNAPPPLGLADVCLCEIQHAGRGRRGRRWIAPFGAGIALSVAWTFSDGARGLPSLSLAVGVAISRALVRAGIYSRTDRTFIDTARLMAEAGAAAQSPQLSPEIEAFLKADGALKVGAAGYAGSPDQP